MPPTTIDRREGIPCLLGRAAPPPTAGVSHSVVSKTCLFSLRCRMQERKQQRGDYSANVCSAVASRASVAPSTGVSWFGTRAQKGCCGTCTHRFDTFAPTESTPLRCRRHHPNQQSAKTPTDRFQLTGHFDVCGKKRSTDVEFLPPRDASKNERPHVGASFNRTAPSGWSGNCLRIRHVSSVYHIHVSLIDCATVSTLNTFIHKVLLVVGGAHIGSGACKNNSVTLLETGRCFEHQQTNVCLSLFYALLPTNDSTRFPDGKIIYDTKRRRRAVQTGL